MPVLTEDEFWDGSDKPKKISGMKNTFFKPIKKQKFSKEILKDIIWGNINDIMKSADGQEGYLNDYDKESYFAYRYHKLYNIEPDVYTLRNVISEKFISELFKYTNVPKEAYYKSIRDSNGLIKLYSSAFALKYKSFSIYVYVNHDTAMIFYPKHIETDSRSPLHTMISLIKGVVVPNNIKNKIYIVYQDSHGFQKTGFTVKTCKINLDENYNNGFSDISNKIIDGLNKRKTSNLVILRGDPGTGKTTYLRHLAHKLKKNIIFISPDMVNHITEPAFIPFLMENANAILIIEDGEPVIGKRELSGRTGAVSNILNLTDGLLSDCLNISIVVTLNTKEKDIDEALLRKGRLLISYKFEKLAINKSKFLLEKLGRDDIEVKEPMTLADIYVSADNNNKSEDFKRNVGFGK